MKRPAALLALVATLLLSGCGNDDGIRVRDDSPARRSATPTPKP